MARDQITWEAFYRHQLTHNIQVTPGLQWTFNPAMNPLRDLVRIAAILRMRVTL